MTKRYFYLLDGLRFLAAFWVMSFHYFLGFSGELSWFRYGNLGVPLFFIISGFVIAESVKGATLKSFAINRFIRLYPIFWIICTLTFIFTLLMPNGNPVSFPEYLISMTMLGEKLANALGYMRIVDAAYWSLVVELIFYVAIGIFVYLFSFKRIRYFTFFWLLISIASFYLQIADTFIMKTLLVRHASYFLFGITLSLLFTYDYKENKRLKYYDIIFIAIVAIYSTYISKFALPPYLTPHNLDTNIVTLIHPIFFITAFALVFFSKNIKNIKLMKALSILGGITYPLYLIHQTVGNTIISYFSNYLTLYMRGVITMIFIITISYLLYKFDEKLRKNLKAKLLK